MHYDHQLIPLSFIYYMQPILLISFILKQLFKLLVTFIFQVQPTLRVTFSGRQLKLLPFSSFIIRQQLVLRVTFDVQEQLQFLKLSLCWQQS